ncbi:MAG: hypothetical protein P8X91_10785 [Candidatus Bathyarchaeota archaeon]
MVRPLVLVVGLGEVGRSLFELLKQSHKFEVFCEDINKEKMREIQQNQLPNKVNILHICYRCEKQEDFLHETLKYIKEFKPELTIINSTVPPGTTAMIHEILGGHIVHSPIRGMHQNREIMKKDLLFWTKYIGGVDNKSAELARKHFKKLGMKTKILRSSIDTELAKLFSTTYRAWMIACFQEFHRLSRAFGADFNQVTDFLEDTHKVRFDRPVHFPGVIGGHCLVANSELLLKSYDSEFVKLILKSNEARKKEMENPEIAEDVGKITNRVKAFESEFIKRKACSDKKNN